jgi:hypothetical protein
MELKPFLSSCGKSFLLCSSIIRELDRFVNGWEMNKGGEKTNPMESTRENIFLANVLVDIVSNKSILDRFHTFNCDSDVHNDSNEAEAEGDASTSFAGTHLSE